MVLTIDVTATPETAHFSIQDSTGFLILATDGIFDVFSSSEVVKHVSIYLNNPNEFEDCNVATHLIRMALTDGKGPLHLSRMLSLPYPSTRDYRDDMTVQIIFFKSVSHLLPPNVTTPLSNLQ